ncbi:MAG: phage portal protein [Candidatus Humimicrobiaceae bacterium]
MAYNFKNIVDVAKNLEPTIFTDEQLTTINELIKYQDYYDNKAFKYIEEEYPEFRHGKVEGGDYKPAQISFNYAKRIVNQGAAWQFEVPIDFNCTSVLTDKKDSKTPSRSDEIEKDLYDIHKKNLMDIKLLQSAIESNIAGGVVFKLKYDEDKKNVRILPRNRIECFPVCKFDDYEDIYKVHFIAFQDEKTIWKQTFELVKNPNGSKVCWVSEALYDTQNIKEPKEVIIELQPLKINGKSLDFMPVYIIPNMAQLGEIWGPSEIRDLISIINEIHKKYSDLSDSLRFDMFAITIFLNAKLPVDEKGNVSLKNKAGAAWRVMGMSPNDTMKPDVFKLQSTFNYTETLTFLINSLVSALYEFAEAVNISPEKVTGLPALSGIALKLLFATIISKTNRKNTVWKAKLAEIYMGALKIKSLTESYEIPEDLDIEIITHVPMPQNELEAVQIATNKLAAGLSSVETEMNKLGIENPEVELAKIVAERLQYDKVMNVDTRNQSNTNTNTNNQNGNQ